MFLVTLHHLLIERLLLLEVLQLQLLLLTAQVDLLDAVIPLELKPFLDLPLLELDELQLLVLLLQAE